VGVIGPALRLVVGQGLPGVLGPRMDHAKPVDIVPKEVERFGAARPLVVPRDVVPRPRGTPVDQASRGGGQPHAPALGQDLNHDLACFRRSHRDGRPDQDCAGTSPGSMTASLPTLPEIGRRWQGGTGLHARSGCQSSSAPTGNPAVEIDPDLACTGPRPQLLSQSLMRKRSSFAGSMMRRCYNDCIGRSRRPCAGKRCSPGRPGRGPVHAQRSTTMMICTQL
jgi:hypothetical protein